MKKNIFGYIFSIFYGFLIQVSHGVFVDIGNLPSTVSLHEDTTGSAFVYSVSVYPTTAVCTISSGNADGNFDWTDKGNGQYWVTTGGLPTFSAAGTPTYTLTIECNSGFKTADLTVNIEANSPFVPTNFIAGVATTSISAKTVKSDHVIFTVSYTDTDDDPPLTYTNVVTDPVGGPFRFAPGTDHVEATQDLLDIQTSFYTLRFDASDARNTKSLELEITITDVNTPPIITNLDHILTLPESTKGRQLVFTINYVDNDADPIQFVIVSKQDADGVFEIILATGEVYLKEGFTLDYETSTSFEYIVSIKDEYHSTTGPNGNLTIIVADSNEAPFWPSALDPVSVNESATGVVVGTPSVLCDDPDGATDVASLKYRILFGSYSAYFSINQTTAEVTFAKDWDYDDKTLPETFLLTLQCVDPNGVSASTDYNITILDINDNDPVCNPSLDTLELLYSQTVSESITHLNCDDADSTVNAELEYTILGLAEGYGKTYFVVDTTGNVTISKMFQMDYNSTFYVIILVNDKGTPSRSTTVTLTVTYTEKPIIVVYEEVTTCFLCTTGAITLVAGAALVVAMLCIFLGTLCVLRCCYTCEQSKMKKLIASEHKPKTRFCDCCRPKRRHRKKKNTAAMVKAQQQDDEYMRARERFKKEQKLAHDSKNQ